MKYLYGDSTPFPLVDNFLVTLCAATEACVAILRADELVEDGARQVREAEAKASQELARLQTLAQRIEESFGVEPVSGVSGSSPTEQVTHRIAEFAHAALKQARAEVLGWRDAALVTTARSAPHALVLPALGAFLVKHQLPGTVWSIQWRSGPEGNAAAELYSRSAAGIEGTYEVAIPPSHAWSRSVRVGQIEKEATISLTRKRFLRDAAPCPERLDKLFITSVVHTSERASMTLHRSPKDSAASIEIVVRNGDANEVMATCIESDGSPAGPPELLSEEDAATVRRVWAQVEASMGELVLFRSQLSSARHNGVSIGEIAQPASVATAIIDAIGPIVREIAARSSNKEELALKRQIGDGRREELFIPHEAVLGQLTALSPRHQALFDAYGMRPRSKAVVHKLPPPLPRVLLKVASA